MPESVVCERQAEDRDVVEVVADLAHHLPHPRVTVVAIVPQQPDETSHQRARISCRSTRVSCRTVMESQKLPVDARSRSPARRARRWSRAA